MVCHSFILNNPISICKDQVLIQNKWRYFFKLSHIWFYDAQVIRQDKVIRCYGN